MKFLVAPDKFKDALDAASVARALSDGIHAAGLRDEVELCPLADGGEGTGAILARAIGADAMPAQVLDPLARPRTARWWMAADSRTAVIEMAEAAGIGLLAPADRNPLRTTSFGLGQLIHAAVEAGSRRIQVCVGGSATVDGGAGCLQALGWKFLDHDSVPVARPITGGMLMDISRVQPPAEAGLPPIEVLCDVDNPLVGPRGAAPVFAPQKGARPADIPRLEQGLEHLALMLLAVTHVDARHTPHGGAAGGAPAALHAACSAELCAGAERVARSVNLQDRLAGKDYLLTGEGRADTQTEGGKVVSHAARLAQRTRVPAIAFVGSVEDGVSTAELADRLELSEIVVITPPGTPLAQALASTGQNLTASARAWRLALEVRNP